MSGDVTVLEDWTATYDDPIRVAAGEAVALDGRRDEWDGHVWLWARAADGREGWLPETLLLGSDGGWRANAAFDARELTCRAGDALTRLAATHGWALCRAADGRQGWVPQRNLAAPASEAPIRTTGASA